jgi:hypothetical protein
MQRRKHLLVAAAVVTVVANKLIATKKDSLKVTVRVVPAAGAVATGPVTVRAAGKTFTGELQDGKVTIAIGTLPRGIHPIVATYDGSTTVS